MAEAVVVKNQKKKRSQAGEVWHQLKKNKGAMFGLIMISLIALATVLANLLLDYETMVIGMNVVDRLQGPSLNHLMGTDDMGRDIFWRILYGAKYSLSVGVVAVFIALLIGVPLGAFAGYFGGKLEDQDIVILGICKKIFKLFLFKIYKEIGYDAVVSLDGNYHADEFILLGREKEFFFRKTAFFRIGN